MAQKREGQGQLAKGSNTSQDDVDEIGLMGDNPDEQTRPKKAQPSGTEVGLKGMLQGRRVSWVEGSEMHYCFRPSGTVGQETGKQKLEKKTIKDCDSSEVKISLGVMKE